MLQRWLVICCLLLSASPVWAAPQVVAEQLEYDFGEVVQGDQVDYTFRFKNAGDEPLSIASVHSSCGCTAALLSSKRIAPGELGEVKATFDSARFRGSVTKAITMTTDDPLHPTVRFILRGLVKEELAMQPSRIGWGQVAPGSRQQSLVSIENRGQQVVTLQEPRTTNENLQAELDSQRLSPGETARLTVSGQLPAEAKRLSGYVMIGTDHPKVPQLRLSVSASTKR